MEDLKSFAFQNPSSVPMDSETHGGDDVGIFAIGPYSHLFHSVHEQSYIAHVMAYSACLGPYRNDKHCNSDNHSNAVDLVRIQKNKNFLLILTTVLIVLTNIKRYK